MSDLKPKRPGREAGRAPARSEITSGGAAPSDPPPPIMPQAPPAPEAVAAPSLIVSEPLPEPAPESVESAAAATDDAWTTLTQVQAVLARGFAEIAAEMTGMTRSGVSVAADAAVAMLGARTFAEAVEINASLARRGTDAMIESSAKLSEIGVTAMTEATRPILSRLGANWSGADLR